MTEHADFIRELAKARLALAKTQAKEAVDRVRRDRIIIDATEAGVSAVALAHAANVNKPRIIKIKSGEIPADVEAPMSLGVTAVNDHYPCCGVEVRFHRDEALDPGNVVHKHCPRCQTLWQIERTVLASTDRGRVDELHWIDPSITT